MRKGKRIPHYFIDRDISWLSFNDRVLQEAKDPEVPLIDRLKFLAIFSNNLDEFFRVRVATHRRLLSLRKKSMEELSYNPTVLLREIQTKVIQLQDKFQDIYHEIIKDLAKENIFIVNEKKLNQHQENLIRDFFRREVLPHLFPVIITEKGALPELKDKSIYFAIHMYKGSYPMNKKYALLEIPTSVLNRFYVFPKEGNKINIILLDDIIRHSLNEIFSIFDYDHFEAYTIKLTRDAELDIDNDTFGNILTKISKSLKQRSKGLPVRFVYDETIPFDYLSFLVKRLKLSNEALIPGGRYHNFKDYMKFPRVGGTQYEYKPMAPLAIPELDKAKTIFDVIRNQDVFLYHPYHSFDYTIRLLREAALDPNVIEIKISLYRLGQNSNVANALINAVKNGKKVNVIMELKARFDEEHNIYWANKLVEEGARVTYSSQDIKVHCKMCLITRIESKKTVNYCHLSTGNYNAATSKLYCDAAVFTTDKRITTDVEQLFRFLLISDYKPKFKHIITAPMYLKAMTLAMIDTEIRNAKKGIPAYIDAKMNSLVDEEVISKLYEASNAGVKIRLIIRGICRLVPGIEKMSANIEVISIIDKYLEHARFFIFCNGGKERYFISSADWMNRNFDVRVEAMFPIFDKKIKQLLRSIFELQYSDTTKAREINKEQNNHYRKSNKTNLVRSQTDLHDFLRSQQKSK